MENVVIQLLEQKVEIVVNNVYVMCTCSLVSNECTPRTIRSQTYQNSHVQVQITMVEMECCLF